MGLREAYLRVLKRRRKARQKRRQKAPTPVSLVGVPAVSLPWFVIDELVALLKLVKGVKDVEIMPGSPPVIRIVVQGGVTLVLRVEVEE